jgi:hypothetical protein
MSVDPLKSHALPAADLGKIAGAHQSRRQEPSVEQRSAESSVTSSDSIQLSDVSHGLVRNAQDASAVPQGTLSPERMHTVLGRLADGFYDGADVRAEVARRVAGDLGNSRPE